MRHETPLDSHGGISTYEVRVFNGFNYKACVVEIADTATRDVGRVRVASESGGSFTRLGSTALLTLANSGELSRVDFSDRRERQMRKLRTGTGRLEALAAYRGQKRGLSSRRL